MFRKSGLEYFRIILTSTLHTQSLYTLYYSRPICWIGLQVLNFKGKTAKAAHQGNLRHWDMCVLVFVKDEAMNSE